MGRRFIRWIFFDVGYTLLDETPAWREQFGRLRAQLDLDPKPTVEAIESIYQACCTSFAPKQWRAVVERCATPATVDRLLTLSNGWRHDLELPYPHVEPTLAALADRYKLGVIANQSLGTRDRLERHGLLKHLSLVIGSAEAGVSKPDPQIFRLALEQANCNPVAAVMVGDRLDNDIRPANELGMSGIHVRQGGSGAQRPRDVLDRPAASIDTISHLTPALIETL